MAKNFVALVDPVHALLRSLTRRVPLQIRTSPDGMLWPEYAFRPADLPEAYYALALFHGLEGTPLPKVRFSRCRLEARVKAWVPARVNYFDGVKLDRRCARDLRLKLRKQGPGMLAAEVLSFGTGMLRARNDDPAEPLHQELWRRHGRLHLRQEEVFARIRALSWNSLPLWQTNNKESFDSTNVIYGDAFGELEQLWERRADTDFLELVARSLQRMRRGGEIAAYLCPPLNVGGLLKLHLRSQAKWTTPPSSARGLLRRLEYILSHTTVDHLPLTLHQNRPPPPRAAAPHPPSRPEWETDRSGYDGWLSL